VSWNVHASLSRDTLADEITDAAASLVLARSPFGYGDDPDGGVAPANALADGAGWPEPHPAASRAAATSSPVAAIRLCRYGRAVIRLTSLKCDIIMIDS